MPDPPQKLCAVETARVKIILAADETRIERRKKFPSVFHPCSICGRKMNLLEKLKAKLTSAEKPEHLRRGELGERAAKKFLQHAGLKFLTANFRSERGEVDLVFRDSDCLVFIEVKARSSEEWTRPAAAVDARKRRLLSQTALDYLKLLKNPPVKIRFDIVEVLLADGEVQEIRHLPNTFAMARPYRYG
jgi:putative endonuclease